MNKNNIIWIRNTYPKYLIKLEYLEMLIIIYIFYNIQRSLRMT